MTSVYYFSPRNNKSTIVRFSRIFTLSSSTDKFTSGKCSQFTKQNTTFLGFTKQRSDVQPKINFYQIVITSNQMTAPVWASNIDQTTTSNIGQIIINNFTDIQMSRIEPQTMLNYTAPGRGTAFTSMAKSPDDKMPTSSPSVGLFSTHQTRVKLQQYSNKRLWGQSPTSIRHHKSISAKQKHPLTNQWLPHCS